MPHPIVIHASVEYGTTAWGGIATALELMLTAARRAGRPTLLLTIGPVNKLEQVAPKLRVCTVGIPELASRPLYLEPDRIRLGVVASQRMAAALPALLGRAPSALFVHNEELRHLLDLSTSRHRIAVTHGLATQEHPDRPDLIAQEQAALTGADAVVALSAAQREAVRAAHPQLPQVHCVPLPLALLAERIRARPTQVGDGTVVAAGRAVPQKGFDLLIGATASLTRATRTVLYCGHGEPAYLRRCRELASATQGRAVLRPWLPRAQLLIRIRRASVVCVPSRFEPLGLMAAEAQAAGVPVVASAVGGLTELVTRAGTGGLVPAVGLAGPRPNDLAGCLDRVLDRARPRSPAPGWLRPWSVQAHLDALDRILEQ